jgi:hypothetical protein
MTKKGSNYTGPDVSVSASEPRVSDKPRRVSNKLSIKAFFHCGLCLAELPDGQSAQQFSRLDVGSTEHGWQVWCRRHECNVVHVDFEGMVHPADTSRKRK